MTDKRHNLEKVTMCLLPLIVNAAKRFILPTHCVFRNCSFNTSPICINCNYRTNFPIMLWSVDDLWNSVVRGDVLNFVCPPAPHHLRL